MADPMGLDVRNIKVSTRTVPNPNGAGSKLQYVVQFMVGAHGPFENVYDRANYNHASVTADINKEVAVLRQIHTTAATT